MLRDGGCLLAGLGSACGLFSPFVLRVLSAAAQCSHFPSARRILQTCCLPQPRSGSCNHGVGMRGYRVRLRLDPWLLVEKRQRKPPSTCSVCSLQWGQGLDVASTARRQSGADSRGGAAAVRRQHASSCVWFCWIPTLFKCCMFHVLRACPVVAHKRDAGICRRASLVRSHGRLCARIHEPGHTRLHVCARAAVCMPARTHVVCESPNDRAGLPGEPCGFCLRFAIYPKQAPPHNVLRADSTRQDCVFVGSRRPPLSILLPLAKNLRSCDFSSSLPRARTRRWCHKPERGRVETT